MRNSDLERLSKETKIRSNTFGLCEGRHEIEGVEKYIFTEITDVFDFKAMNEIIHSKLKDVSNLHLYVTGLTVALTTVLNYCSYNRINVTLYHYDRENNAYVSQVIYNNYDLLKEGGY